MTTSEVPNFLKKTKAASHDQTLILPQQAPSFAWLVMLGSHRRGRLHRLPRGGVTLGRAEDNDITLDDESASRYHARLYVEGGNADKPQFFVQDLASANGVFANGQRVAQHPLRDDDHIAFGETAFAFKQL